VAITVDRVVTLNQQNRLQTVDTATAASLVADMHDAGIARGVALPVAYRLAGDSVEVPGERAVIQAESDRTVRQVDALPVDSARSAA
jgi:hypothetical protein